MTKVIQQSVTFPASPERLFEIYIDSRKHSAATGAKATVSSKTGGRFAAFDGMLSGQNLVVIPNQMIVQAWRGAHWKKTDGDSILILKFSKTKSGGRVELVHVNVPDHDHAGVTKGWSKFYWKPWRAYLRKKG
jgi:activator of HSP90 ATPase